MVFIVGLPIFFAELVVGQYSGMGPNKAYARMAPFFSGLGYCTLVVSAGVTLFVPFGCTFVYLIFVGHNIRYNLLHGDYQLDYILPRTLILVNLRMGIM